MKKAEKFSRKKIQKKMVKFVNETENLIKSGWAKTAIIFLY